MIKDFFFKFWEPVTLIIVTLMIISAKHLGIKNIEIYLDAASGGLLITLLLWVWKLKIDIAERISNSEKNIKKEVDENETMTYALFHAFRNHIGDKEFESIMRNILQCYPKLIKEDGNHLVAKMTLRDLSKLSDGLKNSVYDTQVFDVLTDYPKPFYTQAKKHIIATNIVSPSPNGYWPVDLWKELLLLNKNAYLRLESKNKKNDFSIRRIFIFEEGLSDEVEEKSHDIMESLINVGISVRYISKNIAVKRIDQERQIQRWRRLHDLEDFSVFDSVSGDVKYAGRFRDVISKTVQITTNTTVVRELEQQFEALWEISDKIEHPKKI